MDNPGVRKILDSDASLPPEASTQPLSPVHIDLPVPAPESSQPAESAVLTTGGRDHPTQIGRYHILEIIGEGGMGIVYKAEQRHPVRRTVALKLIKLGMDTRAVLARFEAERQVLALMSHANVARVFDAGITDTGRPFFVMEFVSGEPITAYCDRHRLSTRRRFELFRQACDAVHHAHQKAVIHRDIKPSNVLVSVQDGNPIVKVIDFGVAKALNQRLTEHTLYTEQGQIIGTPEYMSPEQAEMNVLDIDIRTDVYSLGVLLYELLTGALPFDSQEIRKGAFVGLQRVIRDVDPPRPSTRLSELGEAADKIASNRSTDILSLGRELHGELEWVPLKAMRKDRTERYRSASELSDDIDNYLHFRPLIAGPQTATYRLKKFIRKHRHGAAIAAILLAAFLALSTALAISTRRAILARNTAAEKQKLWEQEATRAQGAEKIATAAQKAATDATLQAQNEKERAQALLADLFQGKGTAELLAHRVEPALVYLTEAYQLAPTRITLRFQLGRALRAFHFGTILERRGLLAWNQDANDMKPDFAFSPDETRLVAFSYRDGSTLYNPADGRMIANLDGTFQEFSSDSRYLLVAAQRIRLIASADGSEIATFDGKAAALIPGQPLVVTSDQSGQFRVYDIESRKLISTFKPKSSTNDPFNPTRLSALTDWGGTTVNLRPGPGDRWQQLSTEISSVVIPSSDGQRLITLGAPDHAANIWDPRTGRLAASIRPARGVIIAAAFDPQRQRVATVRLRVPGEAEPALITEADTPTSPPVAPTTTADLPSDPLTLQLVVELWSLQQPAVPRILLREDRDPNGSSSSTAGGKTDTYLSYHFNGLRLNLTADKLLLHIGRTGELYAWRTASGAKLLTSHSMVAVSADGNWAFGRTANTRWGLWNIEKAKSEHASDVQMENVVAAAFFANGKGAYTLESDGTLVIWGPLHPCPYHANDPENAHFRMDPEQRALIPYLGSTIGPNAKLVVAREPEGTIHVVDPSEPIASRHRFTEGPLLQLSPDRRTALLRAKGGPDALILKDLSSGRASPINNSANLILPSGFNSAFSPDGSRLLLIGSPGPPTIAIVDVPTGAFISAVSADIANLARPQRDPSMRGIYTPIAETPQRLVFSPNSKLLAILHPADNPTSATILDLATGDALSTITSAQTIDFASFTPDAGLFIASTKSGVSLFDTRLTTLRTILDTGPALAAWTNSPGSRLLVITAKSLQLWDTSTLQKIATLEGDSAPEFSPDGARLINSNSSNRRLPWGGRLPSTSHPALFDTQSGNQILELPSQLRMAQFSADSTQLLGVIQNAGASIWNAKDGTLYCHVPGDRQKTMNDASFTPNKSILRVHNVDGPSLWSIPEGRLIVKLSYDTDTDISADGSALIGTLGVQEMALESRDPATVRRWVNFAIPLRLSGLEIVKATAIQQWLAESEFRGETFGWNHPQTIQAIQGLIADTSTSDLDELASFLQRVSSQLTPRTPFPQAAVDTLPAAVHKALRAKMPQVAESIARSALKLQIQLHDQGGKPTVSAEYLLQHVLSTIGRAPSASQPLAAPFDVNQLEPSPWLTDLPVTARGHAAHLQLPIAPGRSTYLFFSDAPRSRFYVKLPTAVFAKLSSLNNGDPFKALCGATVQVKGIFKSDGNGPFITLDDANDLRVLQPPAAFSPKPVLTKFYFDYNFSDDPGKRRWIQTGDETWEERYDDGRITRFKRTSFVQEGLYPRPLLRRIANEKLADNFEVLIPPPVDGAWFQYRGLGQTDWINLARIHLNE